MSSTDADLVRVVLADDTPEIREALRLSLELDGRFLVVGEARNGAEAVRLANEEHPHVLLLDLAMPVMDGLQAIPHIRRVSPASRIAVLSGFAADKMSREALDRGADLYVEKGMAFRSLAQDLLELCGRPVTAESAAAAPAELTVQEQQATLLHELRRPLAAIHRLAGDLRAADDGDRQLLNAVADALTRSADSIQQLVARLTDSQTGLTLTLVRGDFATVVHQELDALRTMTAGRLLRLSLDSGVEAHFDPVRIRPVVGALLMNAVGHTPPGTPIEVALRPQAGVAELSVRDHGPGIPPEDTAAVFDRRTGLGLFVAKALARAHGGELRLTLPEDGGCRFVLTLPLAPGARSA